MELGLIELTLEDGEGLAGFPAGAFQEGVGVGFGGPTEAQVGDEGPVGRDIEGGVGLLGIEDGHPAEAEAGDLSGEPEGVNGHDNGISESFGHGAAAEAGAGGSGGVGEDGEVDGGFAEAGEFELPVVEGLGVRIGGLGGGVGGGEVFGDGGAAEGGVDEDPAPGLGESDGGGEGGLAKETFDEFGGNGRRKEVADIAAPAEQGFKIGSEHVNDSFAWYARNF